MSDLCPFVQLASLSSFSFGQGASQPEELVARAQQLGYGGLAITDEASVAGVVRAHGAAQALGLPLLPGASFQVPLPGQAAVHFTVVVLPRTLAGWGALCRFITAARRSAPKGQYRVDWLHSGWASLQHCVVLLQLPFAIKIEAAYAILTWARCQFGSELWLGAELGATHDADLQRLRLEQLQRFTGVPVLALPRVLMHVRSRKPLHDVLTAVRLGCSVAQCGTALQPSAEAHLRPLDRLQALYPQPWLSATAEVAQRCRFSLVQLRYHYPLEAVLPGQTPAQTLRHYTEEGAQVRYPQGVPDKVRAQLEHELELIAALRYEMYFLTVHDIVRFARSQGILCQGRGSAANSAVCYCLGVTEVDPARSSVLFERFISRERDEPPDIDVDFEHQRREEVIQYIYAKYGRERAAIAATVISYRPRSALRDVGRALGLPEDVVAALCKEHPGMYSREVLTERLHTALAKVAQARGLAVDAQDMDALVAALGLEPLHLQHWLELARTLQRFPRHLSQHVGGFVLTQGPLTALVPVENAAMPDRSIIQWDKDDLDAVGLLKVDVLALGMLSAIRRCLQLMTAWRGVAWRMQDIPAEDAATYDMVCAADTVGVFQIESRAQMSMLPRLQPRCFYDLVVEVAIVRPGPIQGGMVHPYLKARANPQAVTYASPGLEEALKRTLGVPIFQEQVMQVAMAVASFSAGEADQLRRSMAAWKRKGGVLVFFERMVQGMLANGHTREYAEQLFKQIEGFGEYGFPESHAASFALLVYVSCWLKRHEPACFLAAMLNSQPLGFYGPSQLVQDARRHGVEVRAVDVQHSDWDCSLEAATPGSQHGLVWADLAPQPAVRLGLRMVGGLHQAVAERIAGERRVEPFASVQDLALRCRLDAGDLRALASADALHSLSGHRRQQVWEASALHAAPELLREAPVDELPLVLHAAPLGEEVVFDYAASGLSLRAHPLTLLREQLSKWKRNRNFLRSTDLADVASGRWVRACGLVTARQRPQTAKGVVFVTLEDETGSVNVIVWAKVKERFRDVVYQSRLMAVAGQWQRDDETGGQVRHLIAHHLEDLTPLLGELATRSRDFH
ncbi:error-prone DNA polymerase [Curvibacter sp. APW13]|uniref:error-prone DNA polymerase n=1 Tax=Curvibacter sp. APW13 TaxID=3077236 RepID=UPI0028DEAFCD|nr:error-prone DNA polymerase [Curvibacter sp. APW13]MDT8989636.1 error-prone DNA polymerase [Curvibacter sp. APW13]